MERTPRINSTEWMLFLGALGLIDLFQFGIEQIAIWFSLGALLLITEPLNIFLDVAVGILIPLYLRLRGQTVTKPGQIGGLLGTFMLEMIPGMTELPLWILDGFWYMYTIKKGYAEEDAKIAQEEENQRMAEQNNLNDQVAAYQEEQKEEIEEEEGQEEQVELSRGQQSKEQTRINNEEAERNNLEEQAQMEQLRNVVNINQYRKIKNTQNTDAKADSGNDQGTKLAA